MAHDVAAAIFGGLGQRANRKEAEAFKLRLAELQRQAQLELEKQRQDFQRNLAQEDRQFQIELLNRQQDANLINFARQFGFPSFDPTNPSDIEALNARTSQDFLARQQALEAQVTAAQAQALRESIDSGILPDAEDLINTFGVSPENVPNVLARIREQINMKQQAAQLGLSKLQADITAQEQSVRESILSTATSFAKDIASQVTATKNPSERVALREALAEQTIQRAALVSSDPKAMELFYRGVISSPEYISAIEVGTNDPTLVDPVQDAMFRAVRDTSKMVFQLMFGDETPTDLTPEEMQTARQKIFELLDPVINSLAEKFGEEPVKEVTANFVSAVVDNPAVFPKIGQTFALASAYGTNVATASRMANFLASIRGLSPEEQIPAVQELRAAIAEERLSPSPELSNVQFDKIEELLNDPRSLLEATMIATKQQFTPEEFAGLMVATPQVTVQGDKRRAPALPPKEEIAKAIAEQLLKKSNFEPPGTTEIIEAAQSALLEPELLVRAVNDRIREFEEAKKKVARVRRFQ